MPNQLLTETKYDRNEIKFLVDDFTNSFSLGYQGKTNIRMTAPNLRYLNGPGDIPIIWNKVMKEVGAKRYAGPFTQPPFDYFIQSPIGLVEKDNGKDYHLVFHLSYPRKPDKDRNYRSVNANTLHELCTVTYLDFSEAVRLCMRAGRDCKISKSDMRSAFRHLCLRRDQWFLMVLKAKNPMDGKFYYFFDKNLAFGASISCALFQRFSNSIAHIVRVKTSRNLVNYLDDYFFVALLQSVCNAQIPGYM